MQTKKKRFCFIIPSYFSENIGGSELQCYYIAKELISRGWDVHYLREAEAKPSNTRTVEGINLYAMPERKDYLRWSNVFRLGRTMNQIKADIWYCRGAYSYLPLLIPIANIVGGKVVWAFSHDSQLTDTIFKSQSVGVVKRFAFAPLKYIVKRTFQKCLKYASHVIVQNNEQRKILWEKFKIRGYKIPNGHPLPAIEHCNRNNIILWVGRMQAWKRPSLFVDLAKKLTGRPYHFIMIGKNTDAHVVEPICWAARKLDNFQYKGELAFENVNSMILRAKILVCTSKYEGFPNVFLQAWLRGLPVLSLNVDPSELIKKHKLGKVCKDVDDLCEYVDLLMNEDTVWKQMSENCIKYARENFDIKRHVNKLERIINA